MSADGLHSPLHAARRAGGVAIVCAEVSLTLAGKLPWPVLLFAVVLTAIAIESLPRRSLALDKPVRFATTTVALLASAAAVLAVLRSIGTGDPAQLVTPLRDTLPVALVVIGLCHASAWRRLRDVQSGLVVGFGLIAMAAVFATNIPAGVVAVAGGPAILVGIRHTRWQHVTDQGLPAALTNRHAARRPGVAATVAAVAAALLLSLLLPFSAGTAALGKWTASHGLQNGGVGSLGRGATGHGSDGTTPKRENGSGSYTGGPLDLRMRGDLPGTPLLRVDNPGDRSLWRSSIYSRYTGSSVWLPAVNPEPVALPATGVVTSKSAPVGVFELHVLAAGDSAVYAPGDVLQLASPDSASAYDNRNGTMSLAPGTASYTVTASLVPTLSEATKPLGISPDASTWTELPSALPARVRDLGAQLAGGVEDPRAAAGAVETYLRTHESYTLESRVPAEGEDAVDAFLFKDHLGFCEQFASAETILLRAAHIPARLVTGLADGTENGAGGRDFKASDLHAWVEFWVPGTGWVSSDPTAGAPLMRNTSAAHSFKKALARLLAAIPFGRFGLAGILLVVAAIVAFALFRGRRRVLPRVAARVVPYGPATDAYRRLQRRLAPRGQARLPQETVRDHARRLGADPALTEALAVVEDEVFAAAAPPPERSAQAAAYLDARSPVLTKSRERLRRPKALK